MSIEMNSGRSAAALRDRIVEAFARSVDGFGEIATAITAMAGAAEGDRAAVDGVMFALHFAAAGAQFSFEQDAAFPIFEKFLSYTGKGHGIGNPDCTYHHAALDAGYVYRVSGNRGTMRILDVEVASFTIADRRQVPSDGFSARGIEIPPGEDFEIILSREPHDGLWLQLPEAGPCFIIVRQYCYDWDTEIPARLRIERIDATYPPPPPTQQDMLDRCVAFEQWMKSEYLVPNRLAILVKQPNTLATMKFGQAFLQGNFYMNGVLRCAADEALIIDMPVPDAAYWNIAIFDSVGGASQPHMRQTSINGHQAVIDEDGVFRAIVAHRDPGYANWLDGAGREVMLSMARVTQAKAEPTATVTRVPFAELAHHLPDWSKTITAEQRQSSLRRRLESAYRRLMIDY